MEALLAAHALFQACMSEKAHLPTNNDIGVRSRNVLAQLAQALARKRTNALRSVMLEPISARITVDALLDDTVPEGYFVCPVCD